MKSDDERLLAEWERHPKVVAFHEALVDHALERLFEFVSGDLSFLLEFANQWIADNGPLPDTGIKTL